MKQPLVSIVILNWNGLEDTRLCLESLKDLRYKNYEVILVDNGSSDSSKKELPDLLNSFSKSTEFIDLPKNTGFTGGHIAGFKASRGEIIFLLNNDSVVDPEIINNALNIFEANKKAAAIGGRAFFWNKTNPIFDDKNQYYSFQEINPITAEVTTLEDGPVERQPNNVSGSAVFIKREAINKVGYLDPRFFAYYEESDLFARMKRAGYEVIYSPDIKIWHKVGAATKDKPGFFYYLIFRNQFVFAHKHFDAPYLKKFLRYYFYTFFFKASIFYLLGRDRVVNGARLKSFFWNIAHLPPTLNSRRKLFKEYGPGYSDRLISETPQPISVLIDAIDSSKEDLRQTLKSIDRQFVMPKEVVVTSRRKLSLPTDPSIYKLRQVTDKKIFDVAPWNLAFICSNEKWILLVKAGERLNRDFIKQSYLTALETKSDIVYPRRINKEKTPREFRLRTFKKRNLMGHDLLISRHVVRSVGGFDNHLPQAETIWKFIARAIVIDHIRLAQAKTKVSRAKDADETKDQDIFTYVELGKVSPFHYLLWTTSKPLGRLANTLKAAAVFSPPVVLTRVMMANLQANRIDDQRLHKLRALFKLAFSSNIGALKKALIQNYDLVKEYRLAQGVAARSSDIPFSVENLPIFINCRDRVEDLKKLVDWLVSAGVKKIAFIDNDSTYPELLKYYADSPFQVLPLGLNRGHRAPWESLAVITMAQDSYYVVSDPDVVPAENCPADALDYFYRLLQKHSNYMKAGFGLKIDDLPKHYLLKDTVINWESQFWKKEVEPAVYDADIDTTFALYRPNTWYFLEHSLRTGQPYVARHTAWYHDSKNPRPEDTYYQQHASRMVNTWNMEDVPEHFKAAIAEAEL